MTQIRDLSIRYKLVAVVVATSSLTLLLATGAFLFYDVTTYKDSMARDLSVEADIIAVNCTAALTFEDYHAASVVLSAMEKETSVTAAMLLSPDGTSLAEYKRWDQTRGAMSPLIQETGYQFLDDRLAVRRGISFDGVLLGYVYLESDLSGLRMRMARFISVTAALIVFALSVVFTVSGRLQKFVSMPILALAETVDAVTKDKNFSVRAHKYGNDEVGGLIDGFNEMLEELHERDVELARHRDLLEEQVAARTGELQVVNNELEQSQERLRAIFEGTASKTGKEFLDALVMTLARALGTRWVSVGMLKGEDTIQFLTMWDGRSIQRDNDFPLLDTPCSEVIVNRYSSYSADIRQSFPDAPLLKTLGVESYVGYALTDRNGRVIGVLSAFHDDTLPAAAHDQELFRVFASRAAAELERLQVEKELQRSEASTRAILRSAADGIITVDGEHGTILTANPATESIFGRPVREIVGRKIDTLVRPSDGEIKADDAATLTRHLMSRFVGTHGEAVGLRTDGKTFPVNIAANEMRHEGRTAYTAIVRDVTREHELEKLKADFISTVSHEIRTPLSCILASANILRKHVDTKPDVVKKFSGIIHDETNRLSRLVNDMLDLSKMDSGSIEWHVEACAPVELATTVATMFNAYASEREVSLETDFAPNLAEIQVDGDKIRQVLINLVSNALKFTDPGGRVCITVKDTEGGLFFSVSDTGIGIAPADQQLVFERFKQIGDVQTDRPQGTGLGLPICKQIVNHFGGEIWIDSRPGDGSTFCFNLPRTSNEESKPRPAIRDDKRPVVLVVDDDKSTRTIIAFHLESSGIEVVHASGGREALAIARREKPDLITLDVMMPDLLGYDVVAALRNDPELKHTPVVLLSVLGGQGNDVHALQVGADAFLDKPVDGRRLLATVHGLLGDQHRHLLLVVDDAQEACSIDDSLRGDGYEVSQVYDEQTCLETARTTRPDLIVIGGSGQRFDSQKLIARLREDPDTAEITVVLLTGLTTRDALPLGSVANPDVDDALAKLLTKIKRVGHTETHEPLVLLGLSADASDPV